MCFFPGHFHSLQMLAYGYGIHVFTRFFLGLPDFRFVVSTSQNLLLQPALLSFMCKMCPITSFFHITLRPNHSAPSCYLSSTWCFNGACMCSMCYVFVLVIFSLIINFLITELVLNTEEFHTRCFTR